ncbi:hypothetical protein Hden_0656 [Hyphomicrobium denitrificans ATCC 51888]|uniref:Uncharacterized protein n=1 Tax=Hyphomicrobium denitrificans (strain ATCC 51888 / DSM 1869 / NCIMB 11706 / TK 0415) TaxID=582899 RepID=D8JSZ2_HYPDA|nr:phage tail assembly protein [Hyphomicrobium denitrificans]ADJ22477.1 hypothetical protein Hden_0656 [Hyphomicrobium denitrificans ATCC 51888]
MMKIRLEHPIDSGLRDIGPAEFCLVRNLRADELEALADAEPDEVLARITGLSPFMVTRLTPADRTNIQAARAAERGGL